MSMHNRNSEFTINEVFRGLSQKDMTLVKSLIPLDTVSADTLIFSISSLTTDNQLLIDNLLDKAIRIQRTRYYFKRALLISSAIVAAGTIIIIGILFFS